MLIPERKTTGELLDSCLRRCSVAGLASFVALSVSLLLPFHGAQSAEAPGDLGRGYGRDAEEDNVHCLNHARKWSEKGR